MLSERERADLRQRAMTLWQGTKRLLERAEWASAVSTSLNVDATLARLRSDALREASLRAIQTAIEGRHETGPLVPNRMGVGLVAASRGDRMSRLHDAVHACTGRVYAASDGPTAVGLAISEQPDVAVVEDHLAIMSGLEAAIVMRAFNPCGATLLITSDPDADREARGLGIATQGPSASLEQLLATLGSLVA